MIFASYDSLVESMKEMTDEVSQYHRKNHLSNLLHFLQCFVSTSGTLDFVLPLTCLNLSGFSIKNKTPVSFINLGAL